MRHERASFEKIESDFTEGRIEILAEAEAMLRDGKPIVAARCFEDMSTDMFAVGLQRWRRKGDDPSGDFRLAAEDAVKLAGVIEYITNPYERSPMTVTLREAMYGQLLVGDPIHPELRRLTAVSSGERAAPDEMAPDWFLIWDDLVFGLAETGEVPAEWDAFYAWLAEQKQTKNMLNTLDAYAAIARAGASGDAAALLKAVKQANGCYGRRGRLTVHWGGKNGLSDLLVDFRLAAVLKQVDAAAPGLLPADATVHRWKWTP